MARQQKMIKRGGVTGFGCVALVVVIPLATLFYREFGALPMPSRIALVALPTIMFISGWFFVWSCFCELGNVKRVMVAAAAGVGILLSSLTADVLPFTNEANIDYSDGSIADHVQATNVNIWGRSLPMFTLHPQLATVRVPYSVNAKLAMNPGTVNVWFSKPKAALMMPDGSIVPSNGITAEVTAVNARGGTVSTTRIDITQAEFFQRRWINKKVISLSGISEIKVVIYSLPRGSIPNNDTTLVAFEPRAFESYVLIIGRTLLVSLALANVALFCVLFFCKKNIKLSADAGTFGKEMSRFIPLSLPIAGVLAIVWLSATRTSYVFFWDFRNYWEKTEFLYGLMHLGAWAQIVNLIAERYAADYSMLPAVIPAFLGLLVGYPNRLTYLLSITLVYAIPAYMMVAYLAKRLLNDRGNTAWVLASFAGILGFPIFLSTVFYMMLDIGGVPVFVSAVLLATKLIRMLEGNTKNEHFDGKSIELVCASLGLGLLLSLMFLFRRWYVFAAGGIIFSCFILILVELWHQRREWRSVLGRVFAISVIVASSALPLLAWVMFDWSRNLSQHDYSNMYAAYKTSLHQCIVVFFYLFGAVVPVVSIGFLLVLWRLNLDRKLLLILVMSSVFAALTFLMVQSPSRHHFYLLMPLLGASFVGFFIAIFKYFRKSVAVTLSALFFFGGLGSTWISGRDKPINFVFPGYWEWEPKQQIYGPQLIEIAHWLLLPQRAGLKYCVAASSDNVNSGIFSELWQIAPNLPRSALEGRMIQLGEVDSRDGPPNTVVRDCDIFIVGEPFQHHLPDGEQYNLQILQDDLIRHSGIGKEFEKEPKIFVLDADISILAYERTGQITDDEYNDLVRRFLKFKAVRHDCLAAGK